MLWYVVFEDGHAGVYATHAEWRAEQLTRGAAIERDHAADPGPAWLAAAQAGEPPGGPAWRAARDAAGLGAAAAVTWLATATRRQVFWFMQREHRKVRGGTFRRTVWNAIRDRQESLGAA